MIAVKILFSLTVSVLTGAWPSLAAAAAPASWMCDYENTVASARTDSLHSFLIFTTADKNSTTGKKLSEIPYAPGGVEPFRVRLDASSHGKSSVRKWK